VPRQIAAAFEDVDRHNRMHAPATSLLRTFHTVLDLRLPERTALLTEQLGSPDPGTRHDAIRMARDLMASWRGERQPGVTDVPPHSSGAISASVSENVHW
jgi:hypothetical protein